MSKWEKIGLNRVSEGGDGMDIGDPNRRLVLLKNWIEELYFKGVSVHLQCNYWSSATVLNSKLESTIPYWHVLNSTKGTCILEIFAH